MTILILHGIGGYAGIHWQQWLYDRLIEKGYQVIMPGLPNPDHPDRTKWTKVVRKVIKGVDLKDLVIIGHSLGVVTALDVIEELNCPVKALISVSGFSQDYGAELNSYFLKEKEIDFDQINRNLKKAFVSYGDNDPYVPQEILKSLADRLGVKPQVFASGGHLNTDTGYTTFPELLKIINKLK
ncbi:MAG TPA: alpha/beta fold hydrolase [Candidatus Bathyarchaeia archaeon]|nr:alpha/beta fold hydrolase [Candidatus Bathyarchaeia archaeon]